MRLDLACKTVAKNQNAISARGAMMRSDYFDWNTIQAERYLEESEQWEEEEGEKEEEEGQEDETEE